MKATSKLRQQCLEILLKTLPLGHQEQPASLASLFPRFLEHVDKRETGLAKNICYGVCRHYFFLDALINHFLKKRPRNKDADILCILFAASYELLFLETPQHAVVSEWVALCKTGKKPWAAALVNAFLRNLQRTQSSPETLKQLLLASLDDGSPAQQCLLHEHPAWMIERFHKEWPQQWRVILAENNQQGPMVLRVNQQRTNAESYIALLKEAGIDARPSPYTPNCLYLSQAVDVNALPGFSQGLVSIQDEAAQQAAFLLNPCEGHKVLDACAAPGGKSAHLLERVPSLELDCIEINADRLSRLATNLDRLSFKANLIQADASDVAAWWQNQPYDRILLDAPCTASGIIRRNPDIKIHRQSSDIARMHEQQFVLIQKLWPCLKPGGLLLYSTCSLFQDENQHLVARFLTRHKNAHLKPLSLPFAKDTGFGLQLFPTPLANDGFFYALLEKTQGA